MALIYITFALITLTYMLCNYLSRNFNYWSSRYVVGPKPILLFGNLKESALRKKHLAIVIKEIYDEFPNEKVVGIFRMTTPSLLLRDLDVIKHVMINDFDYFSDRGISMSEKGLGANLFHAQSATWRPLRSKFTPLFTSVKLKNMTYLMDERGDKFVEYLHEICKQRSEQDVYSLVQKYTIATISACAFGLDVDTFHGKIEQLERINKIMFKNSFIDELDMMYPGILRKVNNAFFPAEIATYFEQVVENVFKQRNGIPTNRKDFMDVILELRQQGNIQGGKTKNETEHTLELSDNIIIAQAFVFFVGGYETSATTMAFMLYELAKNPAIQEKLIVEIDKTLKKYNGEVTFESVNEMKYLEKVFNETLRMYPIVEPIQRCTQADYIIPGTDITVKKGQIILVSPIAIHNDETHYPDPKKFDPERFSPESIKDRHPCAYMPFGVGPRNCIGMRFGKFQTLICMIKLLSNFRVEPSQKTMKTIEFALRRFALGPKGGIYLNIIPRGSSS